MPTAKELLDSIRTLHDLEQGCGTHFDPGLLDIFRSLVSFPRP